ncbi:MAG: nuclear transport factor 2 family protein [Actinobacteria bacterium]|nr:nuclear transport factor 2 family protein [Acidobacteriota bacterium]MCA1709898.1 nuclear transport factor 2 family protein [Actinomycetota bacterium]
MAVPDVAETVRRYYQLADEGELELLVQVYSSDAVYHRPGYEPIKGHSGLTRFYSGERVIESGAHQIDDLLADGERAAVQGVFRGVLKDQTQVELRFAEFFVVRDDKIVERRSYFFTPLV